MSFCCLRTKLFVHFRGKYICNDSMQCSYTVCCGVQFFAVLWMSLRRQWRTEFMHMKSCFSLYQCFPLPAKKNMFASTQSKGVPGYLQLLTPHDYRTVAGVDTGWKRWLGYIFDTLHICLILVPITFYMQFMFVHWAWCCYFHIFNMKERVLKAVMIIGT